MAIGTHMSQEDYAALFEHARVLVDSGSIDVAPTDEEAICLVNREVGFEASRIEILHEAELDATEPGNCCVQMESVVRLPMYAASDWNYVRFNVHSGGGKFYYEMVNAQLYQVCI